MSDNGINTPQQKYNKNVYYFTIGAVVLLLSLFIIQWYVLNKKIDEYKSEKVMELDYLQCLQKQPMFDIKQDSLTDSTVLLKLEDIEEVNQKFITLYDHVQNNTNRAESLIDKDIDRLNLYMAIGIGFVGILGVFVPLVVNFMSVNDLKEKLNEMPNKKDVDSISKKAKEALSKTEELEPTIDKTKKLIEWHKKAAPEITSLMLQNAIGRFFNLSPILITKLVREESKKYFVDLLITIKEGFEKCESEKDHFISENDFLKKVILDFRSFINETWFHSGQFTEEVQIAFEGLRPLLQDLSDATQENESQRSTLVVNQIDLIIQELNNI